MLLLTFVSRVSCRGDKSDGEDETDAETAKLRGSLACKYDVRY
jgi:hypothetical protein